MRRTFLATVSVPCASWSDFVEGWILGCANNGEPSLINIDKSGAKKAGIEDYNASKRDNPEALFPAVVFAIDNFAVSHGRLPFQGPRSVAVCWA